MGVIIIVHIFSFHIQHHVEMRCLRVCFDDALLDCSEWSGFNASLFTV